MAETYHTNLTNVAYNYLKELDVKITRTTLRNRLLENPFFPSLYSLSNTFEKFGIESEAYKIDSGKLNGIPTPFIAYLKGQNTGKDFVLVKSVSENNVEYVAGSNKPKRVHWEEFFNNWEGIVLLAISDEKSGEKDYLIKRKEELNSRKKHLALVTSVVLIFVSSVYFFLNSLAGDKILIASLLLLIKMTGLAATVLLLVYEIDKSNTFVKNICAARRQTNCAAVLESKSSKILGMSWSEVGFFYFSSTFLFLLFPGISFTTKILVLSAANILATPYIIFSIYYQWKVVKQWCALCLTVQGVLLMELIWCIGNYWRHPTAVTFPPFDLLYIIYPLALSIVFWYILKPLILKAKDESVFKAAYKRLLYNPATFNHLLQQQASAPEGYQHIGIEIGNSAAENTIIKVCNPYCGPCAKAHPVLDEIVHNNQNVKLKLIFTATNEKGDPRGIAARHLLAIHEKDDALITKQALDDWYLAEEKDYETFAAKYPLNGEIKMQEEKIEKMQEWCKEAEITFTPTIFINGYRLPLKYKIEELKNIF